MNTQNINPGDTNRAVLSLQKGKEEDKETVVLAHYDSWHADLAIHKTIIKVRKAHVIPTPLSRNRLRSFLIFQLHIYKNGEHKSVSRSFQETRCKQKLKWNDLL